MSPDLPFLREAGRLINAGQSRSLLLHGNVHDLFPIADEAGRRYVDLSTLLQTRWGRTGAILVTYEVNGAIQIPREHRAACESAWDHLRNGGEDRNERAIREMLGRKTEAPPVPSLTDRINQAVGDSLAALEILRQLTLCSRRGLLPAPLILLLDNADALLPDGAFASLSERDRARVSKVQDWLSDPAFAEGPDTVVLMAESQSLLHHRVRQLPQIIPLEVPPPDRAAREAFLAWFAEGKANFAIEPGLGMSGAVGLSSGLTLQAFYQVLKGAFYRQEPLRAAELLSKVEAHVLAQLGEDVVEFKKPTHTLADVMGFTHLKTFLRDEFIPRIRATGPEALPGAAVAGPVGSGKSFIFEAVAGELGIVVLTLKNIRSQWYGQTDVIFEKLRRVLIGLERALIFVDEADTQFGGVGEESHSTERRLTGKIQALMADPAMRGKVTWLLITARIHRLSPDLRRPGRAGSLIIPVLDPQGDDAAAFADWVLASVGGANLTPEERATLHARMTGYSSAMYAALRSELKAKRRLLTAEEMLAVIDDQIPPAIESTRRFQTLQALLNCTRRQLLDDPAAYTPARREAWAAELRLLEMQGEA